MNNIIVSKDPHPGCGSSNTLIILFIFDLRLEILRQNVEIYKIYLPLRKFYIKLNIVIIAQHIFEKHQVDLNHR